ncbi:MAG: peptide chain release factor N(5)-glutamine methyltransferase [Patescibacteria group bacterium]|nr:peptide chain release factor N(5)-glutamine methyltransferase [Patescibacteria group bacterium]
MTVESWLRTTTRSLSAAGIATARLDALVLLEDAVGQNRGYLLAHPELEITASKLDQLTNLLTSRAQHVPLSYLRGQQEFYGRSFFVAPGVLVPRPESETMIDQLKTLFLDLADQPGDASDNDKWQLADIGTGSGALGITAALELPKTQVSLIEIDDAAITIAKTNVISFATDTPIIQSDLLATCSTNYDVLLCNLPYVPDDYPINKAAEHEPKLALFGGADGLDLYRRLFQQISNLSVKPLYILTEALPATHNDLAVSAVAAGYKLQNSVDFIQIFVLK